MTDLSLHDELEMPPTVSKRQAEAQRTLLSLAPEELRYFVAEAAPDNPKTIDTLLRILVRERAIRSNKTAFWIGSGLVLFLGAVISTLLILPFPIIPASYLFMALVLARGCIYPRSPLERATLDYLLVSVAPRHIPLLLEQRPLVTNADCARIDAVLLPLLPRTTAEDWQQMTSGQQDQVIRSLSPTFCFCNRDLSLEIIVVLGRLGDQRALPPLYHLAAMQASTPTEHAIRSAAQEALQALQARLDFGQPERVPTYLDTVFSSGNTPSSANHIPVVTLYALLALLPKLTPENYFHILSKQNRERLYALFAPATTGNYAYDKLRLYREIVQTLERVGDTSAIRALNTLTTMRTPFDGAKQLRKVAQAALQTLQAQLEKENAGRILLRAADAPGISSHELLRAVAPACAATAPNELLRVATAPVEGPSHTE